MVHLLGFQAFVFIACISTRLGLASIVDVYPHEAGCLSKRDHGSCVEFSLADNLGTGWRGAQLYIYDNHGNARSYAPDPMTGYSIVKYCYNRDDSSLAVEVLGNPMLSASYKVKPDFTLTASVQYFLDPPVLSVVWNAKVIDNAESFSGNHMSTVIFRGNGNSIVFNNARNLVSSPLSPSTCTACIIGKNRSYRKLHAQAGDFEGPVTSLTSEMSLYGHDNTWFRSEGFSTTYEITDSDGTSVFYTGMLCNKNNTDGGANVDETFSLPCDIDLSEGNYIWRVNGALDSFKQTVAWEFCSTRGSFSTELHFNIDQFGVCSPISVRLFPELSDSKFVDTAVSGSTVHQHGLINPTSLTLQVAVDFIGLESIQMSRLERALLECAFLTEFEGGKSHFYTSHGNPCETSTNNKKNITLLHWQEVITDSVSTSLRHDTIDVDTVTTDEMVPHVPRKESSKIITRMRMHRLSFTMNVISEEYGFYLHSANNLFGTKEIAYSFKRYLKLQMESGIFLSRLRQMARSSGFKTLLSATKVKLGEVKLVNEKSIQTLAKIRYVGESESSSASHSFVGTMAESEDFGYDGILALCVGVFTGLFLGYLFSKWLVQLPILYDRQSVINIVEKVKSE